MSYAIHIISSYLKNPTPEHHQTLILDKHFKLNKDSGHYELLRGAMLERSWYDAGYGLLRSLTQPSYASSTPDPSTGDSTPSSLSFEMVSLGNILAITLTHDDIAPSS